MSCLICETTGEKKKNPTKLSFCSQFLAEPETSPTDVLSSMLNRIYIKIFFLKIVLMMKTVNLNEIFVLSCGQKRFPVNQGLGRFPNFSIFCGLLLSLNTAS